ncbi:hypothetical protein J2T13_002287 [Paenibacillus sp. DS2015]|uniref:Ig-like domain-containing protein n=1 Tax=Paenibacillus sp. DS2015 TaxID=3373917 RepID=UPI003D1B49B1
MNRGLRKIAILMLVTIFAFTSAGFYPEQVSAATPETRFLTIKHDDFSSTIDIDGNIPGKTNEKWLQRNGVAALVTDSSSRNVLRLTPNLANMVGSAFYGDQISFGKERSFSTYFSFRMSDPATNEFAAGDGLVFSIQTLSKEAGAKGGGMGYGGLTRSFGIEFDTFANPSAPRDPKAISVNIGSAPNSSRTGKADLYDTSHIAIVANGNMDHSVSTTSPKGTPFPASIDTNSNPNIIGTPAVGETAAIANLKTADSGTWATNNAYPLYNGEIYHTWIVYNGPTDTMEVYLGKDANFSASKLKIKKSGIGLREYLEQDEAYVGFTAATASAFEKHDILQWYLTNNDLPIEPQNTNYTYVVAPPMIEITSTDFVTYGAVTSTTSRIVKAKLLNYDGTTWNKGPYPVTFSMFKEGTIKNYTFTTTDGKTKTVALKPRTDDNRISLKGEQRRVNSEGSSMRYATVMSDENGIATIQISNMLSTAVNDSNVKAIVGDHFGNGVYGGGAYAYEPVDFAADIAPPTISSAGADVSNPNHVKVLLSEDAIYPLVTNQPENWHTNTPSTWNTGGFTILIPDKDNPGSSIRVPTIIVGGSGAPDEPLLLELANGEVVPHGFDVQLEYIKVNGSIQDVVTNLMINQTILIDDYPFIPKGAMVVNNQARKTVEVNFDFPVLTNNIVPGSFSLYYDNGLGRTPVAVTGVTSDASDSKKLLLTLNSAIPAGATVTINYNIPSTGGKITNVSTSGLGTGHHSMKQLTDFSVVNQMAPIRAVVVNDSARNKVKVSFASEVELQGTVATLASALKIGIDSQIELIDVSNIIVDSSDVTGKTLILTLAGPHLPTEGVPFGNIVQLDYDSTIANVDVREKTGSKRNLEWLSHFPVENQYKLNVAIVGPVDGTTTNDKNIVVTGTSDPGKTVTITVNDKDGDAVTGVTVVDPATGSWTFTPSSALTDGTYLVTAQVSDTAGNEGSASSTFTVDTVAPNVAIVSPADGVTTNNKNTVVTGTSDPGTAVTVTVKDKNGDPVVGTIVVVPATGSWTFTPTAPLTDGEYTVAVEGSDPSGNKGMDSSTFTVDTVAPNVAIVSPADGVTTNNKNTVVTGTSDPGTVVTVTVKDKNGDPVVGTIVVVPATGSWTFTPTAPLTDGEYTVAVEGSDPSGNKGTDSSTFTVDTVAPNVAIVSPADGVTTNNKNTVVTGTSDPGTAVTVTVKDKNGDPIVGTIVVVPATGSWTFTPTAPLTDGEYTVAVEGSDPSGNKATDSSTFTVDTVAPSVAIVGPIDGATTNNQNTIVLGTSDPGVTVTVAVYDKDRNTVPGTIVVVPATGSWTFTPTGPLVDDEYTVTVEATDPSGNKGTDSSTFTVDTVAPNVAIVGPADGTTTNDKNTVVTGTSDPGTTVTVIVEDKNGDPVPGSVVVVPATGSWTFTPTGPLVDGKYTVTVEATDPSGNKGTDSSTFTVDTVAPSVAIVGPIDGATTNNQNTIVLGTSDPGVTVTVAVYDKDRNTVPGTIVVVPATGNWTFTPTAPLTDGEYTVTVEAEDPIGNKGRDSSIFTVDTVAPNVAIVGPIDGATTNDPDTVVTGTSEPGTTVKLTVEDKNGDPIVGTTVVDPTTGEWTFTPTGPLVDDEYTVTVEATDPSGNKGTDSSTFTVDTVAPSVAIIGPIDGATTNDPDTVVTGTSEPGTTVVVTVEDKNGDPIVGTIVVVPATGSWTFTPTAPLTDGDYTVIVEGSAPSGNKGTDNITFTVNTQSPNVAIVGPADGVTTNNKNTVVTGTSDPGVTVTVAVYDKARDTVPGTMVVDSVTGNWTFTPTAPLMDGEYSVTVEGTDPSGNIGTDNSKFTVNTQVAVSYFINLKASPDMLVADGKSISVLTAIVTDNHGNLISNVDVDFSALIENTLTSKGTFVDNLGNVIVSRVTTYNGIATIIFKSEAINSINPVRIEVKAVVHDLVHGIHAVAAITMVFEPAVVSGVITDGENHKPVVGAIVTLLDADGLPIPGHTSTTDADGKYSIPVTEGNKDYWISVTRTIGTGSNEKVVTYLQKAMVNDDITGLGQEFVSDQTIAGIVAGKSLVGTVQPIDFGTFVTRDTAEVHPMFAVFLKDGSNYVTSSKGTVAVPSESDGFSIDGNGGFVAGGLTAGTAYDLEVRYYYDVKTEKGVVRDYIVIARKQISISKNGEMNINEELIDPFGIITDSLTHLPIANAQVILKYANTERNRNKGITPGTSVVLPELLGFPPANNANPQFSDSNGNYAYMVYGNTDYIIEAKATGYEDYRSVVIGIDNDIVRWDFQMKPITKDSGSTSNSGNNGETGGSNNTSITPPMVVSKPDVSINIVTERSTYEEGSEAPFVIIYKNEANQLLPSGQIIITLPDNVMVIDGDGGIVKGNTITWEVKDLATGQSGSHQIRLKFPTSNSAEKAVSINGQFVVKGELVHPLNAIASVKVMLFSNRFGNIQHIRYILGYPDHTFKPEKSLTRAELATIIARLIGEYDEDVTMKYSDVPQKFWASSYIQTVTRHNIFTGYTDGSFHPNAPVTREELAVVMVRFLKLEISQPIETHFADAMDRWSSSSIEALYRNRLITGYPNGTFKPRNSITRREAVTMVNHMMFRGPLMNISPSFPDVPSTSWGFGDIEEATRSHESKYNTDGNEEYIKSIRDTVQ